MCIYIYIYVHGDSLGKNTEVGCHSLLQGIFPAQGSKSDQWSPSVSIPVLPTGVKIQNSNIKNFFINKYFNTYIHLCYIRLKASLWRLLDMAVHNPLQKSSKWYIALYYSALHSVTFCMGSIKHKLAFLSRHKFALWEMWVRGFITDSESSEFKIC